MAFTQDLGRCQGMDSLSAMKTNRQARTRDGGGYEAVATDLMGL